MRSTWGEFGKHIFILSVLVFAFFPLYVTFAISVKNNKQFNNEPFGPLALSGLLETFDRRPAQLEAYDPKEVVLAQEALATGLTPTHPDWPQVRLSTKDTWHWENWTVAWDTVGTYIFNTIVVAVTAVVLALCCSTAAGFFFARYRMPGTTFLWYFFLVLMLMPGVANLVPLFILLRDMNLINSLLALIILGISGAQVVQIFILRNFIEEIPQDMFDAADVDGASPIQKFIHITLPQITAIISILFMIRFIWNFNKFEDIFLLTGGASGTRTLPINVYQQGFAVSDIGMGSAVSIVIVMLLLSFMVIYFRLIGKRANEV